MIKFKANPLRYNKLRTAGLNSINSARFGKTRKNRDGSARSHQGIDLATDEGFRVYAVEDGEIVGTNRGLDGYGFTVTLKIKSNNKLNNKYAFYAHLDRIDVKVGQTVKAGKQIGLTGDTGNALGMTTEEKGGHLHFELRVKQWLGKGLKGRLDPEPYIKFDNED